MKSKVKLIHTETQHPRTQRVLHAHVHTYTHTHTHTFTHTHTHTRTRIHARTHAHTQTQAGRALLDAKCILALEQAAYALRLVSQKFPQRCL